MSTARVCLVCALLLAAVHGCASGPRSRVVLAADQARIEDAVAAYADLAASEGDDVELLSRVAGALLSSEACGPDSERAALATRELGQAGLRGEPYLEQVIERGCSGAFDATVHLARRGNARARQLLRGFADSSDPEVRAAVVISLSVDLDRALLLSWAADPDTGVRAAAAERLGALGPSDPEALSLLTDLSRNDPEARVRGRAVRALGSYETAAFEVLRERLSDPEHAVRAAAIEALVRADRALARASLLALLSTPTNAETIEAARVLSSLVGGPAEAPSEEDRAAALEYLRRALGASEASLRSQAAVALVGIPGRDDLGEVLRAALVQETDPTARLSMARALLRREASAAEARDALRDLLNEPGMIGTQAAAVLAEEGDVVALEALRVIALSGASDVSFRVVALHALGRLRPAELWAALSDPEPAIRLSAASAILGR